MHSKILKNKLNLENYEFNFSTDLSVEKRDNIVTFLGQFDGVAFEQHPEFVRLFHPENTVTYCTVLNQDKIVSYSAILEGDGVAKIRFGPNAKKADLIAATINEIGKFYKKKGFYSLQVQLAFENNDFCKTISKLLKESLPFFNIDDNFNWSSGHIDLTKTKNELLSNFKSNHRYEVRKGYRLGLKVRELETKTEIYELAVIYEKLFESRGLRSTFRNTQNSFIEIHSIFKKEQNGVILGEFDGNNTLIGGVVIFYQGEAAVYKYGATDPDHRKLPIMHLLLFEAMLYAKKSGIKRFDIGGLNPKAQKGSQLYNVDRFKLSFAPTLDEYPPIYYFKLNKIKSVMQSVKQKLKHLLKR